MGFAKPRPKLRARCAFVKGELKRANVPYDEWAERLKEHGLSETRNSIAAKRKRGTFPATFLLAVMAAIDLESVSLTDL
jgi:hypothetical protein